MKRRSVRKNSLISLSMELEVTSGEEALCSEVILSCIEEGGTRIDVEAFLVLSFYTNPRGLNN